MFQFSTGNHKGCEFIQLKSSSGFAKAVIHLNEGGRLAQLKLRQQPLIQDSTELDYSTSFASAILFPFVNRLENGILQFNGNTYRFQQNEQNSPHAIHGLVYNKSFRLESYQTSKSQAKCAIVYDYFGDNAGFPFPFSIRLNYQLSAKDFSLHIEVTNTGISSFPFSIGWHPYFQCNSKANCILQFSGIKKIKHNASMIAKDLEDLSLNQLTHFNGLDDCFELDHPNIVFKTPNYHLELSTKPAAPYLQVFSPDEDTLAIEPMTGFSNSLNYLQQQVIAPKQLAKLSYHLKLANT